MDIKTIDREKINYYSHESTIEDHAKAFFFPESKAREDKFIKLILQNIPIGNNGRILDLGCGIGGYAHLFKNNKLDVTAIDFSLPMCLFANKMLNIKCSVSNVAAIPFKDNIFKFVSAIGLTILEQNVYSFEYKEKVINEIKRVMKDNSFLILSIPNKDSVLNRVTSKSRTVLDTEILVKWLKMKNVIFNSEFVYGLPVRLIGLFYKIRFLKSLLSRISKSKYIGMRRVLIFKVDAK